MEENDIVKSASKNDWKFNDTCA